MKVVPSLLDMTIATPHSLNMGKLQEQDGDKKFSPPPKTEKKQSEAKAKVGSLSQTTPSMPQVGKPTCSPQQHKHQGKTEKVIFNGFPDKPGQSKDDLVSVVKKWLVTKAPKINIIGTPSIDRKEDCQGTVYNILTFEVASYVCPSLQVFNIINGVACIVKHPSQQDCCTVCRKHHLDKSCEASIERWSKSVVFIHEKHELDPQKPNQFRYDGKMHSTFMEAMKYVEEKELGKETLEKKIRHKILSWEANNYRKLYDMFKSQVEQCPKLKRLIQSDLGSSYVVYKSNALVLGSGSYPGHDIEKYQPRYHPGLNFLGSMINSLRKELKN